MTLQVLGTSLAPNIELYFIDDLHSHILMRTFSSQFKNAVSLSQILLSLIHNPIQ